MRDKLQDLDESMGDCVRNAPTRKTNEDDDEDDDGGVNSKMTDAPGRCTSSSVLRVFGCRRHSFPRPRSSRAGARRTPEDPLE